MQKHLLRKNRSLWCFDTASHLQRRYSKGENLECEASDEALQLLKTAVFSLHLSLLSSTESWNIATVSATICLFASYVVHTMNKDVWTLT